MRWDDDDPGLPIKFGPCANDEYEPMPLSPVVRETIRRARVECEENARRSGMSRRRFLLSACAAATTLLALQGCDDEAAKSAGKPKPGGGFKIPKDATTDPTIANDALGGTDFIFDVQNHLLDYTLDPQSRDEAFFGADFPQAQCGDADPHDCFSVDHFLEEIFIKSDTSMAIVSSLPIRPEHSAESIQVRDKARRISHAVCHDDRLLIQGEAHPTLYPIAESLAAMEQLAATYPLAAWKVYTHQPGPPWWLDDHEAGLAQVGEPFIRKAVELGIPRICVHKGLVSGHYGSPVDIGPAARAHPDVSFLVYHSGYDNGRFEGPYTPATAERRQPADHLDAAGRHRTEPERLRRAGHHLVPADADAGPGRPRAGQAAQVRRRGQRALGHGLDLVRIAAGPDPGASAPSRSPPSCRRRYGYPALTDEVKAKIFGRNALRVYDVKPITTKCTFTREQLAQVRLTAARGHRTYGPTTPAEARALQA